MNSEWQVNEKYDNNYVYYQLVNKKENNKVCYGIALKNSTKKKLRIEEKNNNIKAGQLEPDEICLSIEGLKSQEDIMNLINSFNEFLKTRYGINIQNKNSIEVIFNVENTETEKIIKEATSNLGITADIRNSDLKKESIPKIVQENYNREENIRPEGMGVTIKKDDNGSLKKYYKQTGQDGRLYEDNGTLSIDERKQSLLAEWLKDPIKYQEIIGLSREELDKQLEQAVTENLSYRTMEQSVKDSTIHKNATEKETATVKAAEQVNGTYDAESGIVIGDSRITGASAQYTGIEENEGEITKSNLEVSSNELNTNSSIDSDTPINDTNNIEDNYDVSPTTTDKQERELGDALYYTDDQRNYYDANGNLIGNYQDGYVEDENNNLYKNGTLIGIINGNLRDMSNTSRTNTQAKTLTYKREYNHKPSSTSNHGSISLPAIIFIISLVLLIISGIILLIIK